MNEKLLNLLIQAEVIKESEVNASDITDENRHKIYKDKSGNDILVEDFNLSNEEIIMSLLAKQTIHLKHIKIIVVTCFILGLLGCFLVLSLLY